ncbi:MAG: bile acid:sodium symporter family protein [Candidatus Korobacteraceae bacterium]
MAPLTAAAAAVCFAFGRFECGGGLVVAAFTLLALGVKGTRAQGFSFSLWVGAFVSVAMFFPALFGTWYGFEVGRLVIPLTQIIMFGMGTQLSLGDFKRVLLFPKPVFIGMVLQFSVMPLAGKASAILFTSNPEIGAGMVLIGACPGGVASNVMTYLARGNVALSVTMTAVSTLMAPVMTPMMMKLLAGAYVQVQLVNMMISIINMILLPIAAGIVVNAILVRVAKAYPSREQAAMTLLEKMPLLSMFSICLVLAIIASVTRESLLAGPFVLAIVAAAVFHNGVGYLLGYWAARLMGMNETVSRTVSIEVGLQNGGMATALAIAVLKSPLAALPPAIFGTWMNISGAILASWWKGRPPQDAIVAPSDTTDLRSIAPASPVASVSEDA